MKSTTESSSTEQKNYANKTDFAGGLQETILKHVTELGDLLERAGEKTEKNGFEKVGEALYQLGNKIEHIRDRFDHKAPSKTAARSDVSSSSTDRTAAGSEKHSGASMTSSEGLRTDQSNQKTDSIPVVER